MKYYKITIWNLTEEQSESILKFVTEGEHDLIVKDSPVVIKQDKQKYGKFIGYSKEEKKNEKSRLPKL